MKVSYIPVDVAIGEYIEDFDIKENEIDEVLLKKWALDAVDMVSTTEQLVHKIALLDVQDYRTELPEDFDLLCEISYRLEPPKDCYTKKTQITKFAQKTAEGCELDIHVKCPKCHKSECDGCGQNSVIVDVDRIWEMSNSHYYYPTRFMSPRGVQTFGRGEYSSVYSDKFKLLRPTINNWFQLQQQIPHCVNAHCKDCEESYMIEKPDIKVSFKEGEVFTSLFS